MRRVLLPVTLAAATLSLWLCAGNAFAAGSAAAVPAQAHLYLSGAFFVGRNAVTVPGRTFEVQGYVRPYVPGQSVEVMSYVGRRRFKRDRLRIKPGPGGVGAFTERVRSPAAGIVRVKVTHDRSPQMLGFLAERAVAALNPNVGFGARGPMVDLLQQRLAALHLYIPQTGVFDEQTGLALNAYHRLLGWGEGNETADPHTIADLLNGAGAFHVRYPGDGKHVEGDLGNQLLALIYGSRVYRIYPISSGKPSTPTVLGRYSVYSKVPGYLPDGMYFSNFFTGGYAIHGYNPAPDYPASHGCMRVPIIDAVSIYDWLKIGDRVDVYQ
jgi:peptidoglycan hydrolase-like protein with peptidoglycan-binding domain